MSAPKGAETRIRIEVTKKKPLSQIKNMFLKNIMLKPFNTLLNVLFLTLFLSFFIYFVLLKPFEVYA